MKVKSESEVAQSCLTLCDPMDCNLPGSSVRGLFQARVLEWGAIAFSNSHSTTFKKHPQIQQAAAFSRTSAEDLQEVVIMIQHS